MKKLLLLLCLGCFSHFAAIAQLDIKLDPARAVLGTTDISLEYIIKSRIGLELGGGRSFGKNRILNDLFLRSSFRGFFAAKYYFSKKEIGGNFSLGPYAQYNELTFIDVGLADGYDESFTWDRSGLGLILNYKMVYENGFLFGCELGLGVALRNHFYDSSGKIDTTYTEDIPKIILNSDWLGRVVVGYRLVK